MPSWIDSLLTLFALPQFSLGTVFLVSFISATLVPLGSEPIVYGMIQWQPDRFWLILLIATVGNTLGGAVNWWMGFASNGIIPHPHALKWLEKWGAKTCLLAWLPIVGDPLCAVAGWLQLPFWSCLFYMAIGKFLRYITITWALLGILHTPY